jgi:hypothetical protein
MSLLHSIPLLLFFLSVTSAWDPLNMENIVKELQPMIFNLTTTIQQVEGHLIQTLELVSMVTCDRDHLQYVRHLKL